MSDLGTGFRVRVRARIKGLKLGFKVGIKVRVRKFRFRARDKVYI